MSSENGDRAKRTAIAVVALVIWGIVAWRSIYWLSILIDGRITFAGEASAVFVRVFWFCGIVGPGLAAWHSWLAFKNRTRMRQHWAVVVLGALFFVILLGD